MTWRPAPDGVLSVTPGRPGEPGVTCVVNLPAQPAGLPAHAGILLASGPLGAGGRRPADTAPRCGCAPAPTLKGPASDLQSLR
jgi:alpha-glucosidase